MAKTKRESGQNRQKQGVVLPPAPTPKGPYKRADRMASIGSKVSIKK